MVKGQRLELALCAVANQRHGAGTGAGQGPCGHGRHGGGAQRSGEGELAQQQRRARGHIGQHAKRHHGRQAPARVLGVAVDVLERVGPVVSNGHEFDHAVARVAGYPCGFVEGAPAQEVSMDAVGDAAQAGLDALALHQRDHVRGAEVQGGKVLGGSHGVGLRVPMYASAASVPKRKNNGNRPNCRLLQGSLPVCQPKLPLCSKAQGSVRRHPRAILCRLICTAP